MGGKLAIASRVDYYKGDFVGDQLNADIAMRVEEIMRKYPEPPPKERRAPRQVAPSRRGPRPPQGGGQRGAGGRPRWSGKRR